MVVLRGICVLESKPLNPENRVRGISQANNVYAFAALKMFGLTARFKQGTQTDDDQENRPPAAKAKSEEQDEGYGAD